MPQEILIDTCPHLIPLGAPLCELLLVLGSALAGVILLFFDLGGFGFQLRLGSLHFPLTHIRIYHQLKNLVLSRGDFLLGKLDFVQQRLVLLVGFYVERLVAVLGDLAAKVRNCGVVFAPGGFVGFYRALGLFQLSFGVCQLVLDGSDTVGEFGDFILQAPDFLVRFLQAQQVFYF
ncbi:MAG: hypothetical protein WBV63_08750 [Candidatus Sulfotelmatobacter sp.]